MLTGMAMFWFIGAAVVALFAFLSVASWASIRAEERKTLERYALLRKLAEQPPGSAQLVLAHLDAEEQRTRERRALRESRRRSEQVLAGLVLIAVGVGLAIMLESLADDRGLWSVGLIPGLIGVVLAFSGWLSRSRAAREIESGTA